MKLAVIIKTEDVEAFVKAMKKYVPKAKFKLPSEPGRPVVIGKQIEEFLRNVSGTEVSEIEKLARQKGFRWSTVVGYRRRLGMSIARQGKKKWWELD